MIKKFNFENKKMNWKIKLISVFVFILLIVFGFYFTLYKLNQFFDRYYLKFNKIIEIKINPPIEVKKRAVRKKSIKNKHTMAQIKEFSQKEYQHTANVENTPLRAIYNHFGTSKFAVAIAKAESGLNCERISSTSDYGLFQIHLPLHQWRFDKFGGDWRNCDDNARVAKEIYNERGWEAWSAYLNKSYLKFL